MWGRANEVQSSQKRVSGGGRGERAESNRTSDQLMRTCVVSRQEKREVRVKGREAAVESAAECDRLSRETVIHRFDFRATTTVWTVRGQARVSKSR